MEQSPIPGRITANGDGQDISYGYSSTGGCGALIGAGANSDQAAK